jgi:hypothetical protein
MARKVRGERLRGIYTENYIGCLSLKVGISALHGYTFPTYSIAQHAGKTEEENNGYVVFKLNTYLPFRREMKVVRGEALLGPSSFDNRSAQDI